MKIFSAENFNGIHRNIKMRLAIVEILNCVLVALERNLPSHRQTKERMRCFHPVFVSFFLAEKGEARAKPFSAEKKNTASRHIV